MGKACESTRACRHTLLGGFSWFFPTPSASSSCRCDGPAGWNGPAAEPSRGLSRQRGLVRPSPCSWSRAAGAAVPPSTQPVSPQPLLRGRSPASRTAQPLSACHNQAEAAGGTRGRKAVCLPRNRPHQAMLEQFGLRVQQGFNLRWPRTPARGSRT